MQAGIRLLPFVVFLVLTSIINGALMPKFGYYAPWYVAGSALAVIGSALMSMFPMLRDMFGSYINAVIVTVKDTTNVANVYGYTILIGAGAGCYLASGFAVMQSLVPLAEISSAIGFQAIGMLPPQISNFVQTALTSMALEHKFWGRSLSCPCLEAFSTTVPRN
jgi:MFS family permease